MPASNRRDRLIRVLSCGVIVASLAYMATRTQIRIDATAEGLSRITPLTKGLVQEAAKEYPVHISAFISREVPRDYVAHRDRLLNVLRELDAFGEDNITLAVHRPKLHSDNAQQAGEQYGIFPRQLLDAEAGRVGAMPVFLGVALTSGPREEVLPFIDRGLSPEYELARALSVVVKKKKRVVGVVRNDVKMMGDFDLQARRQIPAWAIVDELRKQYEVRNLELGADVPPDIDVVLVPQVSSLSQPALDRLSAYAKLGRPLLVVADPMPVFNINLSPAEPMMPRAAGGASPLGNAAGRKGDSTPKGDYAGFLRQLGVNWRSDRVLYDAETVNLQYRTPQQVLFMSRGAPGQPLSESEGISGGLAQVVAMYAGGLSPVDDHSLEFRPLLSTSGSVGYHEWSALVDRSNFLFGLQGPVTPQIPPTRLDRAQVVAAQIQGEGAQGINAIVLSDMDMFSNVFFELHSRGGDLDGDGLIDQRFDNVSFLLNCIDTLVGDASFLALRSRQPKFRRLTLVDKQTKEARDRRESQIFEANNAANQRLADAQAMLDRKVAAVDRRGDLDERTKTIMARQIEEAENRRFKRDEAAIERDKKRQLDRIETEHLKAVDTVQDRLRLAAVLIPPIPAIALGVYIWMRKRRREASTIPAKRKRVQA